MCARRSWLCCRHSRSSRRAEARGPSHLSRRWKPAGGLAAGARSAAAAQRRGGAGHAEQQASARLKGRSHSQRASWPEGCTSRPWLCPVPGSTALPHCCCIAAAAALHCCIAAALLLPAVTWAALACNLGQQTLCLLCLPRLQQLVPQQKHAVLKRLCSAPACRGWLAIRENRRQPDTLLLPGPLPCRHAAASLDGGQQGQRQKRARSPTSPLHSHVWRAQLPPGWRHPRQQGASKAHPSAAARPPLFAAGRPSPCRAPRRIRRPAGAPAPSRDQR